MPSFEEHRHHFGNKLAVLLGGHVVSTCGWPGLTDEIHTFRRTCIRCLLFLLCNDHEPRPLNVSNGDARLKMIQLFVNVQHVDAAGHIHRRAVCPGPSVVASPLLGFDRR